jgi:hypothetical protein
MKDNSRKEGRFNLRDQNNNNYLGDDEVVVMADMITSNELTTSNKNISDNSSSKAHTSSIAPMNTTTTITTSSIITATKTQLRGRWGTKVDALLRDLLELTEKHPEEKAIVFSQWIEVSNLFKMNNDSVDSDDCQ